MATTVSAAFNQYKTNLEITDKQANLVSMRRARMESILGVKLSLHSTEKPQVIGSWDRDTLTRLLREGDVDVMVVLHYSNHKDWDSPQGAENALNRFRQILVDAYGSETGIRRDVNCITLQFNEFRLDVVPAFKFSDGNYKIPDTVRKEWIWTNPIVFAQMMTDTNKAMDDRFKPLIKMVKGWNRHQGWPIRSFHLECMLSHHCSTWTKGYDYDSMVNHFFDSLPGYVNRAFYEPVTQERVDGYLDNAAQTTKRQIAIGKATLAKVAAAEARALSANNQQQAAIGKWKALMGEFFPGYG